MNNDVRLMLIALIFPLSTVAITVNAFGRDIDGRYVAENPEIRAWFGHLASGKGLCCSFADGTAISDADWEVKDGHYRVRIDVSQEMGKVDIEWVDVPDDAVIVEPNRIGRTMVWPIRGYLGVSIRCFMPGPGT